MKNIYLDIDGTFLLDDSENNGRPALGASEFLSYLDALQRDGECRVNWLTTHCRESDDEQVIKYLKERLCDDDYNLIIDMSIKPTTWHIFKIEAIDFTKDFLWLDDDAMLQDREVLLTHKSENKLIEMDLQTNKRQLIDIIESDLLG